MIDGEQETEFTVVDENTELEEEDLLGDTEEPLLCVIEKLLIAPRLPAESQRNSLFHTRCTINNKVYELLIDSGCTENIISRVAVNILQLKTTENSNPYKISWV